MRSFGTGELAVFPLGAFLAPELKHLHARSGGSCFTVLSRPVRDPDIFGQRADAPTVARPKNKLGLPNLTVYFYKLLEPGMIGMRLGQGIAEPLAALLI